MSGLRRFEEMLVWTREIVRTGVAQGWTLEQLRKEDVLAGCASYESYMSRNDWLETLHGGLTATRVERGDRPWPYGLLFRAWKDNGVGAALAHYKLALEGFSGEPSILDRIGELEKPDGAK